MGNTRPNDKDNPAEKDGFGINNGKDIGGGTFISSTNALLPVIPHVESTQQETTQTDDRMMADFMMPSSFPNPGTNAISRNISSNQLRTSSVSNFPFPEYNLRGVPHHSNQDSMMMAHNAMNRAGFSSIQNQPTNRNFMLRRNAAEGHQMVNQAGETRISNFNRPHRNGDFGSLGGSNSYMMPYAQNSGQPQLGNHGNVDKEQCGLLEKVDEKFVKVSEDRRQRGVQERNNGSFLNLGSGGNQTIYKPKYSPQEIANKLEEFVPPSHVQQTARTFSNLGQNLDADIPSFQTNAQGFLNPVCDADDLAFFNNDIEVVGSGNGGGGSSPFQVIQRPQYAMQQYMPTPGGMNLSSVNNWNTDLNCRILQNNQPRPSGELGGNLARFHNYRQVDLPQSASESDKPTLIPSRTLVDMRNLYVSTSSAQRVVESAMNSPSLTLGASSARLNRAGPLITGLGEHGGSQASQNSGIPQIVRSQPPGHLLSHENIAFPASRGSPFSQRTGVRIASNGAAQGAASGQFPKRLGVETNANWVSQVAERDLLRSGRVQTDGRPYHPSDTRSNLLPNNLLTARPPPIGRSPAVPVHHLKGPPGFASTNVQATGQVTPVATAHSRTNLKRSAMWSPPAPRWVQRQKIGTSTVVHPSDPRRALAVPPIQTTAPVVSHVKWEGSDSRPQAAGEKCYICKRDLSFTSEGPVSQPEMRPAVAVLPCGHTFHDECLQKITPEDEAKDPPCIPCAVNEN